MRQTQGLMMRMLLALALLGGAVWALGAQVPARAQAPEDFWGEATNLSRSGAAETPVVVAGLAGKAQVFWWDRFDGLMTSSSAGALAPWSSPQLAPLGLPQIIGEGETARIVLTPLKQMPQLLGDRNDRVHAWWLGDPAAGTGMRPLLYSRLRIGETTWTVPESLAEAAMAWEMGVAPDNTLHLVYLRPVNSATFPAGLYHKRSTDGGATWSAPSLIYASLYFRLVTAAELRLALLPQANTLYVAWDNPRPTQTLLARSTDGGATWSAPEPLTDVQGARGARLLQLDGVTALWEAGQPCALYWQALDRTAPPARIEGLNACGQPLRWAILPGAGTLLMAGTGSSSLALTVWNGTQFSEVRTLNVSFRDPETGVQLALDSLSAALRSNGELIVAGRGQDGEVWTLPGNLAVQVWAFAPPPLWSAPEAIVTGLPYSPASPPVGVLDAAGRLHVLWSAADAAGLPGAGLVYVRKDAGRWSTPVTVLRVPEGKSDQPALAVVEELLHVVWSGGPEGSIYYSRAYARDAAAAGGWSEPLRLAFEPGSGPQIVADLLGRLHVLYAVPLNEGRGIRYTYSDDAGQTWAPITTVFDAEAAGWLSVASPTLSVDLQGRLLAVWARTPLPGNGLPEALYYAYASGDGESWSAPELLVEGAAIFPQAMASARGQTVVLWQDVRRGTAAYRVSPDGGVTWGFVGQVPGLRALYGPATLLGDRAGVLHLVAVADEAGAPALFHLLWGGDRWTSEPTLRLAREVQAVSGIALAADSTLGRLEAVWSAALRDGAAGGPWGLWHTARAIPVVAAPVETGFERVTPTPTPGPTPSPTPTPRPQVNPDPVGSSMPTVAAGPLTLPLSAIGGIAVALLFVIALVVVQTRKR